MNSFAMVLALLIAACAVIMLRALGMPQLIVFIGGLVVVMIASWFIDNAK